MCSGDLSAMMWGFYSLFSIHFFDFSLLILVSILRSRTFATYSYQDAARELDMDG